jgi:Ser/Thr protein kinase RdoA (MazF antagonist)
VELKENIVSVLSSFGLDANKLSIQRIDSGHINYTYKIDPNWILQRINIKVFRNPDVLSSNLQAASNYLKKKAPEYLFLTAIKNNSGLDMVYDQDGYPWRLFPFIGNTVTINEVDNSSQAFEAARAFGQLTKLLNGCDVAMFQETIPKFHNLPLRYLQFEQALKTADQERKRISRDLCADYIRFNYLVKEFENLTSSNQLQVRITHNDTKINNVLFDSEAKKAICVIDLDTLMPGYFIYDLGDMIRTFVSPAAEDEADLSKVVVRKEIHQAILDGYLSEMGDTLTSEEKKAIPAAGLIMTYMIGLRFLIDYLNGDTYYQISYPKHNLDRAANQLKLLEKLAG